MNVNILIIVLCSILGLGALVTAVVLYSNQPEAQDDVTDCKGTGAICSDDESCCTGLRCQDGRCCTEGICYQDSDCCGEKHCFEGQCSDCAFIGDSCENDGECCSGPCLGGECKRSCLGHGDCEIGHQCVGGVCEPCGRKGEVEPCCPGYAAEEGICRRQLNLGDFCDSEDDQCSDGLICDGNICACYDPGKVVEDPNDCCAPGGYWDGACCQIEGSYCQDTGDCCGDWMTCNPETDRCEDNSVRYGDWVTIENLKGWLLQVEESSVQLTVHTACRQGSSCYWRFVDTRNPWSRDIVNPLQPLLIVNRYHPHTAIVSGTARGSFNNQPYAQVTLENAEDENQLFTLHRTRTGFTLSNNDVVEIRAQAPAAVSDSRLYTFPRSFDSGLVEGVRWCQWGLMKPFIGSNIGINVERLQNSNGCSYEDTSRTDLSGLNLVLKNDDSDLYLWKISKVD
uniref:Uncharacterized protein n=1 Tax=viral metagenome TaxID=1070528 RepID=A0A6C0BPG0_9ZZZZ